MSKIDEKVLQDAKEIFFAGDKLLQVCSSKISKKGLVRAVRSLFNNNLTDMNVKPKNEDELRVYSILNDILNSWTILKAQQSRQIKELSKGDKENVEE